MAAPSCPTSGDGPFFGLISGSSVPCSGQGSCINATGYSTHFSGLCVCNDLYSGESDMFDLRVARMANGTWLSLDCPNPRIGVWTVFSAQLVFLAFRYFLIVIALIRQFKFKGRMRPKAALEYMPYRVLLLETVLAGPILLGLPIQKLLPEGLVIGTDPGPTLCLVIGTFLGSWAYNDFELSQFYALVKASSMDYETHRRLMRRQSAVVWMTRVSYWFFAVVPSLVALGLDKSLGPVQSGEYILLILRNIGIVIWMASQWLSDVFMQREIQSIIKSLSRAQVGGSQGTTSLLEYLNVHAAKTKSTTMFATLIWLFFSLPWFWPFQGYAMTIVTCITVLRTSNAGVVLLRSASIQKKSEQESAARTKNSHQLAPSPSGEKITPQDGSDLGQPLKDANGKTDQFDSMFLNKTKTKSDLGLLNPLASPSFPSDAKKVANDEDVEVGMGTKGGSKGDENGHNRSIDNGMVAAIPNGSFAMSSNPHFGLDDNAKVVNGIQTETSSPTTSSGNDGPQV